MLTMFGVARLGKDAEVQYSGNGSPYLRLNLAFTVMNNKNPEAQWVQGTLIGARAESLAPHLVKGKEVAVTLENCRVEVFQEKGYLKGLIQSLDFVGSKAEPSPPEPKPEKKKEPKFENMDDDIPF